MTSEPAQSDYTDGLEEIPSELSDRFDEIEARARADSREWVEERGDALTPEALFAEARRWRRTRRREPGIAGYRYSLARQAELQNGHVARFGADDLLARAEARQRASEGVVDTDGFPPLEGDTR